MYRQMSDTHEVWKEIAESKGLYSVSDKGRVRNNETKYNIQNETLKYRLKKGMSVEEAVTTPLMAKGRPRKEVI